MYTPGSYQPARFIVVLEGDALADAVTFSDAEAAKESAAVIAQDNPDKFVNIYQHLHAVRVRKEPT